MATREQVRAFLDRPWWKLRLRKDQHNAETIRREGAETALRMADMLHDHAVLMGAHFTEADRRADLAAAIDLRRKLDRARPHRRRGR